MPDKTLRERIEALAAQTLTVHDSVTIPRTYEVKLVDRAAVLALLDDASDITPQCSHGTPIAECIHSHAPKASVARRQWVEAERMTERLLVAMERALDAIAQDEHLALDNELYEAWKAGNYSGCATCKAAFILREALDAAMSPSPEAGNG